MTSENPKQHNQAERLMAMGQMAASLAHEIRNPLGSMELFCTLLKKDLVTQPNLLQVAEQIHLGIRTLDRIISNCLQFARDVAPRMKLCRDIRPILEESRKYAQTKADDCKVTIVVECRGEGAVELDQFLLQQVLVNILLNAVEAAASDSGGSVRLVSDIGRDTWEIRVEDNGPGISAEDQLKMFDPFFTTKQGGTGLGLTIVHSIVTAHGGEIEIESNLGSGTAVIIRFPRGESARNDRADGTEAEQHASGG